jgi:hypothetical protein
MAAQQVPLLDFRSGSSATDAAGLARRFMSASLPKATRNFESPRNDAMGQ